MKTIEEGYILLVLDPILKRGSKGTFLGERYHRGIGCKK